MTIYTYNYTLYQHKRARTGIFKAADKSDWLYQLKFQIRKNKDGPLFSPAKFQGPRCKANVKELYMLVYDLDSGIPYTPPSLQLCSWLSYTTFSNSERDPKWRLILPLAQPIVGEDWGFAYQAMEQLWNDLYPDYQDAMDGQCKDSSRMYYLPSCPPEREHLKRLDCNLNLPRISLDYGEIKAAHLERVKKKREQHELFKKKRQWSKRKFRGRADRISDLKYSYSNDENWRRHLAGQIGASLTSQGFGQRAINWICPKCGQSDATYYYLDPFSHSNQAYCGHLNHCGMRMPLYDLAQHFGVI